VLYFLQSSLKERISIGALWRSQTARWAKQMGDPPWPAEVENTKKQDLAVLNHPKDDAEIEEGGEDEDGSSDDDDTTLINESIIEFFTSKGQGEEDEVEQLLAAVESPV
jgi:hypothetical protein